MFFCFSIDLLPKLPVTNPSVSSRVSLAFQKCLVEAGVVDVDAEEAVVVAEVVEDGDVERIIRQSTVVEDVGGAVRSQGRLLQTHHSRKLALHPALDQLGQTRSCLP